MADCIRIHSEFQTKFQKFIFQELQTFKFTPVACKALVLVCVFQYNIIVMKCRPYSMHYMD